MISLLAWCALSAALAAVAVYAWMESRRRRLDDELDLASSNLKVAESRLSDLGTQFAAQSERLAAAQDDNADLARSVERLTAHLQQAQEAAGDFKQQWLALRTAAEQDKTQRIRLEAEAQAAARECGGLREQLAAQKAWVEEQTVQFGERVLATARELMDERGKAFTENNRKEVDAVIAPFKDQLAEFRQRVDHIYATDHRDRGELKQQILHLTDLNKLVSSEANRLANALTITSKATGDWGETILKRILEESGLKEGREYRLQHAVTGADGESRQPDAVLFLPQDRQLVVDSKVSNKAWKEYCHENEEGAKQQRLAEHLTSLRAHIRGLSAKDYARSPDLQSVDFVLMFVPVEAALLTALACDDSLYTDAFRSKIILVSPSTLMAVVKLVEGIWALQKRKESADEIAEAGRKLYEKLSAFAGTFVELGEALQRTQNSFDKARGQLSTGKGNAIRLAQRMVELGVTPGAGKGLPALLTAASEEGEPVDSAAADVPAPNTVEADSPVTGACGVDPPRPRDDAPPC